METLTADKTRFGALFEQARAALPGAKLPWVAALRKAGLARFNALGWPKPTDEDWRFTPLSPVTGTEFVLGTGHEIGAAASALSERALAPFPAHRLVFINGRFSPTLSNVVGLPAGTVVSPLDQALEKLPERLQPALGRRVAAEANAFAALNAAFFSHGAFVSLRSAKPAKPVHLVFASSAAEGPVMRSPRVVVELEGESELDLVEEYVSLDGGVALTNAAVEVTVDAGACLRHYRLQRESDKALNASTVQVRVGAGARYESHVITSGGAWVRNGLSVLLDAEGASCALNGLTLASGKRHVDNHTFVDHAKPRGTSRELYKGILDGSARTVFNGLITVEPDAQKTDAQVYNKNLLLSEDCLAYTDPEFRIHANDVQCKHGGAIGQLSQDALFYLRSRGLAADESRRLLVHAFASEMIERVALSPLREALQAKLSRDANLEI